MEEERNGPSNNVNRQPQQQQQQQRLRPPHPPLYNAVHNQRAVELGIGSEDIQQEEDELVHSRPEAVTRALRVLQVIVIFVILYIFMICLLSGVKIVRLQER